MTYDDIAAIFLTPLVEPIPAPEVAATPSRRLRDALEPIATQGWWSRPAGERLSALGVDFFPGYVWGRAAALGTPAPSVVAATFGVFEPAFIGAVYSAGSATIERDVILAARAEGAAESVAAIADPDECARIADPLLDAIRELDGLGRPLFSALRDLPVPTSPAGRLWRAAELVREHRGDGHLAAVVASGLTAVQVNVLTERWLGFALGEYSATRGYGPEMLDEALVTLRRRGWFDGDDVTASGRSVRDEIESATDASQARLVDALGDDLQAVTEQAAAVSDRLVDGRSFPADPRKRAAG